LFCSNAGYCSIFISAISSFITPKTNLTNNSFDLHLCGTQNTIMKSKKLLLTGCLAIAVSFGIDAQIINSTQPETNIAPAMNNTGLAIAPNLDVQAAVFADGSGSYRIYWIDGSTGAVVDIDGNSGNDPDVAYYSNADAVVVAYENGGGIYVDDYYLAGLGPVNYTMNSTTGVSGGTHPNVDINSKGRGILTWEQGGDIYVCAFNIGPFTAGPVVGINGGTQPDVVLLDDNKTVALTYIQGGDLVIETMDYNDIAAGGYTPFGSWNYGGMLGYEHPRIAGQRNSNFSPSDDFTVVAQDDNGTLPEVHAFFANAGAITVGPILVNSAFMSCSGLDPLPVVAYNRGRVQIAWTQKYGGGCSGLWQSSPNNEDDVLIKSFSPSGFTSPTHEEVNQFQSSFTSFSKTSLATEYDGNYLINNSNWHESVLFNNPGDLFWKARSAANPSYIEEQMLISEERGNNFSLVTSPVNQTIEILSESDDLANFQMLDNAGRVVELKTVSNDGNLYSIDISHLSGGMYFLNCSSITGQEVLRILHVVK